MTQNNKRRYIALVALVVAASLSGACGANGGGPGLTDPTPVATEGRITFVYKTPECTNGRCDPFLNPIYIQGGSPGGGDKWPDGYALTRAQGMNPSADGKTWTLEVLAPAGNLTVFVIDPRRCSPTQKICVEDSFTGEGLSANGVALRDTGKKTGFKFAPPSIMPF